MAPNIDKILLVTIATERFHCFSSIMSSTACLIPWHIDLSYLEVTMHAIWVDVAPYTRRYNIEGLIDLYLHGEMYLDSLVLV